MSPVVDDFIGAVGLVDVDDIDTAAAIVAQRQYMSTADTAEKASCRSKVARSLISSSRERQRLSACVAV